MSFHNEWYWTVNLLCRHDMLPIGYSVQWRFMFYYRWDNYLCTRSLLVALVIAYTVSGLFFYLKHYNCAWSLLTCLKVLEKFLTNAIFFKCPTLKQECWILIFTNPLKWCILKCFKFPVRKDQIIFGYFAHTSLWTFQVHLFAYLIS